MAKAKKPADAETTPKKKPAAKKAPAKKAAAKPTGGGTAPMIDTGLAAASAARMLLARAAGGGAPANTSPSTAGDPKQFKDSFAKPKNALDNLLHSTAPKNLARPNVPFHQQKQVGHNQTFGADVNRTGVPRRTSTG